MKITAKEKKQVLADRKKMQAALNSKQVSIVKMFMNLAGDSFKCDEVGAYLAHNKQGNIEILKDVIKEIKKA